jgi:hypothetical protein
MVMDAEGIKFCCSIVRIIGIFGRSIDLTPLKASYNQVDRNEVSIRVNLMVPTHITIKTLP